MQQTAAAAVASANGSQIPRAASQASLRAFSHAAREIWVKEGVSGFFAGIAPNTIQVCPFALFLAVILAKPALYSKFRLSIGYTAFLPKVSNTLISVLSCRYCQVQP